MQANDYELMMAMNYHRQNFMHSIQDQIKLPLINSSVSR